ncbi:MAG: hypothetical protein JSW00_14050 [Thermoplasmata archaeon]|nr:MAG: hypothetical protein JSW00_14050 [Thermoplasmata archaeon]
MRGDVYQKILRLVSVVVVLNLAFGSFLGLMLIVEDNVVEGDLIIPEPVGGTIYISDARTWDGSEIPNGTLELDLNITIQATGDLTIKDATLVFQSDIVHRFFFLIEGGGRLKLENSTITVQTTDLFENYEYEKWFNYTRGPTDNPPTQETEFLRLVPFNFTVRDSTLEMSRGSALRFHGDLYIENSVIDIRDSTISSPEFHHMTHDWGVVVQIVDCVNKDVFIADSRVENSPWYQGILWHDPDGENVTVAPIQMFANHTIKNCNQVYIVNTYFDIDYRNKTKGSLYSEANDHLPPGINPNHNALNIYNSIVKFFGLTINMEETDNQIKLDGSTAIEVKDTSSKVALYRWLYVYPVDNRSVALEGATVEITSWYQPNSDIDIYNNVGQHDPVRIYIENKRGCTLSQPSSTTVRCVTGVPGIAVFGLLSDLLTEAGWPNSEQKDGYNIDASYYLDPDWYYSDGEVEFENFPRVFPSDNYVNYHLPPFGFAAEHPDLYLEFLPDEPPSSELEGVDVNITVRVWNQVVGVVGKDADDVKVVFYDGDPTDPGSNAILLDEINAGTIQKGQSKVVGITWNATPTGLHTIFAAVDRDFEDLIENNLIPEVYENNNVNKTTINVLRRPDLFINGTDIYFKSGGDIVQTVVEGSAVTIHATVYNLGGSEAKNVDVKFYDGDSGGHTDLIDQYTIASIPAGGSVTASVGWDATQGEHYIYVFVDQDPPPILESNENNNNARNIIDVKSMADLTVDFIDPTQSVKEGSEVTISASVFNVGGWNVTENVVVKFYYGSPDEENLKATVTIPRGAKGVSIEAGGSAEVSFTWTATYPPASHTFYVKVDPDNLITEGNDNNNMNSTVYIVDPRANLVVESKDIVLDPAYPMNGTQVTIYITIWNDGASPILASEYFHVQIRLDDASTGTKLTELNVTGSIIAANGGSTTEQFTWNQVSPPGIHKIWVIVDSNNTIDETEEDTTNKAYATMIIYKVPSDLIVNDATDYPPFSPTNGTVLIDLPYDAQNPFANDGFTLVEESGDLIIRGCIFSVIDQGYDDEYNIVVKDWGTLRLEDGALLTTDGPHLNIYLYDHATLYIDSSTISSSIDIIAMDNSKIYITDQSSIQGELYADDSSTNAYINVTNSSFSKIMTHIGGNTHVEFWGVTIAGNPASESYMTVSDNAVVYIHWYLTVYTVDVNEKGIPGADVTWYRFLPWTNQETQTTGSDGSISFWLRGMDITSDNVVKDIGNYMITASYFYSPTTYSPEENANVFLQSNQVQTLKFPDVMPDLDPPLWVEPPVSSIGNPTKVKATIFNNGTNTAYDIWVKFDTNITAESAFPHYEYIESIPADGSVTVEFVWIPEYIGLHLITVYIDPYLAIIESNESNNYNEISVDIEAKFADLVITTDDIWFTYPPYGPAENQVVTIHTYIRNYGEQLAYNSTGGEIVVMYYLESETPENFIDWGNVSSVNPGGWQESTCKWYGTTPPGQYRIFVVVDPANDVKETEDNNNSANNTITILELPDVIPTKPSVSVEGSVVENTTDNKQVMISTTVRNDGGTTAQNVLVKFYVGPSLIGTQTIPLIHKGLSEDASIYWTTPRPPDGEKSEIHTISVEVSIDQDGNESNNYAEDTFEVILRPILSVTDIEFSDNSPFEDDTIYITAWILNDGGSITETDFDVYFWDGVPNVGSLINTDSLTLNKDEIKSVTVSWPLVTKGSHSIYVVADANGDIDEADETNNVAYEVIAVYSDRDIHVNNTNSPYRIDTAGGDLEHMGYTLVEENGELIITQTTFRVLMTKDYEFNIIARDWGTIRLADNSVIDTSGELLRIYLYDNSTLIVEDSIISSNVIEIYALGKVTIYINDSTIGSFLMVPSGTDVRLIATNSSLTQVFHNFGGKSIATFTNVYTPSTRISDDAVLNVYKWLKAYVKDGAGGPKAGADVVVKQLLHPFTVIDEKTTGSNGLALFAILTDIQTATGNDTALNYNVSAEYPFKGDVLRAYSSVSFTSYRIDKENNIEEVIIYLWSLLPDFSVESTDISFEKGGISRLTVGVGEQITLTATITNEGTTEAEGALVRFYIDLDKDNFMDAGEFIGEVTTSTIAADGGTGDATVTWIPQQSDAGDNRWVRVVVDPYNDTYELNEGDDNKAFTDIKVVIPPDLSLTSTDISFETEAGIKTDNATEGQFITIEAYISNLGANLAQGVIVYAYDGNPDTDGDGKPDPSLPSDVVLIGSYNLASITPGDSQPASISWDITGKEGGYFIYVFAFDATTIDGYSITDQILTNNHASKDFYVHPKPDLYVIREAGFETNITLWDAAGQLLTTDPQIGATLTIQTIVYNSGQVYIPAVEVSFYDGDPRQSGAELLGNATIELPAKSSTNASIQWLVDDPEGSRDIYVWVNRYQVVIESDDTNNLLFETINVAYAPFQVLFDLLPKSKYNTGETINVRALATFTGTGDPLADIGYDIVIVNTATQEVYSTRSGTIGFNGVIEDKISAPEKEGEYIIEVRVNYGGFQQAASSGFSVEEEPGFPIPLWMILLIIIIAVVVILLVGVGLAKFGLGRLVECGECGAFIPEGEKACPKCGAVFETDTAKCSECGAWIPVDSKSCPDCGAIFAGLEKEKKDYIERMKLQYAEYVEQYRREAKAELGAGMTDESFMEWWKVNPKYVGFEEWLAREEELRKGRTKNCESCNTINPESAAICFKCGTVFKEEEEEEEIELPPETPPPEIPAKRVEPRPAQREAPPPTVTPKKVVRPPEVVPKKVVKKAPPTVVPKKVVRPPEEGKTVVVPKKVIKRPPTEEEEY